MQQRTTNKSAWIYADEPNYSDVGVSIVKPSVPYNYVLEVTENVREIINSSCNNWEFNKAREKLIKEFWIQKES